MISPIDISMMAFGGMERTDKQWRSLFGEVGLTIRKIQYPEKGSRHPDCMIEVDLER